MTLYFSIGSAPSHQVMLTAKALDLELKLQRVDLMKGEHLKPEYLKLNPQHTVPTLVDGDFVMWESRAISRYLVNKYGAGTKLYPQDPQARAVVDQRLDFDTSLYQKFADYFYPQVLHGAQPEEAKLKKLEESFGFLNTFLEGSKYAAGSDLTIADLALVASISTIESADISYKAFPNVERWFELVKTTAPGYQEANQQYVDINKVPMMELLKAKMAQAKS